MLPEDRAPAVVEDVERGFRAEVVPHPWQTDTCIGDWHYNRERFLKKSYMPADAVVHRLCDVVAKNGCLLLSVPVRGDGTIDEEERKIVEGVAGWTARYGEAIFASPALAPVRRGSDPGGVGFFRSKASLSRSRLPISASPPRAPRCMR